MRIAFSLNPALGHLLPLLPLATAARDAGHDVTFLAGASVAGPLERLGFQRVDTWPPDLPTAFANAPFREGLAGRRLAAATWKGVFGGMIAPRMAEGLLGLAEDWPPDLLVHDDSEQGSWIAAERLRIPHVALQATAWRSALVRLSAEPLGELLGELGLPADPALARWHRHGYLATRPPSLVDPDDPPPATSVALRPVSLDEPGAAEGLDLAWLSEPRARPRVAVTLGTMLTGRPEAVAAMRAILAGLVDLDVDVVLTVGPGADPAALGDWPSHVRIERYVPMSRLLAASDALVFHGGSGTMLTALSAGVPLVLLPVAADQPDNADRCEAAGAGIQLGVDEREPGAIAEAVRRVLADDAYRAAARRIAAEIGGMPAPAEVLPRLEALAR